MQFRRMRSLSSRPVSSRISMRFPNISVLARPSPEMKQERFLLLLANASGRVKPVKKGAVFKSGSGGSMSVTVRGMARVTRRKRSRSP